MTSVSDSDRTKIIYKKGLTNESSLDIFLPRHMPNRIHRAYPSLKAFREGKGLSQRAAAAQFGISQSAWWKYEQGFRYPHRRIAKLLMEQTGVPLEVLMGLAS